MTYTPVIPVSGETLGGTRDRIRTNFELIQSTFSENHVPIGALNGGNHTVIRSVNQSTVPTTPVDEPALYATNDGNSLGVLHYSRGGSDAVPTPLTGLHSPSTPIVLANNATTNMVDFTGITVAAFQVNAVNLSGILPSYTGTLWWNGAVVAPVFPQGGFTLALAGNVLQLQNISGGAYNDVYWTINLLRVS